MPNKISLLVFILIGVSTLSAKGQNSTVSPDHLKSNLIQFLKAKNHIDDESKIGMSFYLIDLNTPVNSSNSHVIFPVEIKSESANALQIGFYKFGISSPHLEPYLVIVSKESFDILTNYTVPEILNELELFLAERDLDQENQLVLVENVLSVLNQRHRILEYMTPIEDDLILDHENE